MVALAAPGMAAASSFQINPVLVELEQDKATAILSIENVDNVPISVKVSARSWRQKDGSDIQEETQDLILSPPIATIQPHKTQTIRIGQRLRDQSKEKAYRLVIEEIVPQTQAPNSVRMALRIDIPMYALAAKPQKGQLRWTASRDASGRIVLEAANTGGSRVELAELGVAKAGAKPVMVTGRVGVVLANGSKRWTIDARSLPRGEQPLNLVIRTSDAEISSDLPLQLR